MIINARLVISSPLSRSRSASCGSDLGSNARAALTRAVNGAAGLTAIDLKTAAASKSGPGSSTAIGGAIAGCGFGGLPAPARAPPHVFSRFRLIFRAFPCFSIIAENQIGHTKISLWRLWRLKGVSGFPYNKPHYPIVISGLALGDDEASESPAVGSNID
jgi:hypothetical protein